MTIAERLVLLLRYLASTLIGIVVAVLYGGLTRSVFGQKSDLFDTLSLSFLCLGPIALGALTILFAPPAQRASKAYIFFAPWVSTTLCLIIAGLITWEAWFCILMALPIFWALASLSGIATALLLRYLSNRKTVHMGMVLLFVTAPYLLAPFEYATPVRDSIRTVHSEMDINAPPDVIWKNITNLSEIAPNEQRFSWYHLLGLPRPIQAKMACERVGCVRQGEWEDGLAFAGLITALDVNRDYAVNLKADTRTVHSAMAPLGEIGGKYFDMVDDRYEIQPLDTAHSRLHLYSTYRVSTRVNRFAEVWLDFLMHDIQNYILQVEKDRCESGAPLSPN